MICLWSPAICATQPGAASAGEVPCAGCCVLCRPPRALCSELWQGAGHWARGTRVHLPSCAPGTDAWRWSGRGSPHCPLPVVATLELPGCGEFSHPEPVGPFLACNLAKIGPFESPCSPTCETLAQIHGAHTQTAPLGCIPTHPQCMGAKSWALLLSLVKPSWLPGSGVNGWARSWRDAVTSYCSERSLGGTTSNDGRGWYSLSLVAFNPQSLGCCKRGIKSCAPGSRGEPHCRTSSVSCSPAEPGPGSRPSALQVGSQRSRCMGRVACCLGLLTHPVSRRCQAQTPAHVLLWAVPPR